MTTLEMEIALLRHFDIRRNLIVPCVTDWSSLTLFEIDLLVLSKASYATAVEIKVSLSDLKNDLKKKHIVQLDKVVYTGKRGKEHYFKPFKYFYYAVPEALKEAALDQMPEFAGLLVIKKVGYYNPVVMIDKIYEARKPQLLYSTKWTDKRKLELARLGTMRILTLKQNILNLKQ